MTQPAIHTLSPPELRGYARGLRETAALLGTTWSKSGMVERDDMSLLIEATREAWEREAELVEGFADRIESAAVGGVAPAPVTAERVAEWVAGFEPPIQSFAAAPTEEEHAQPGLADAVAESIATRPPISEAAPGWPAEKIEEARALLVDQGLTYRDVAERTGIPPGTISGWATKRKWLTANEPRPEAVANRSTLVWTEERLALLDAEFQTADLDDLLARVNALPGTPCRSVASLRQKAITHGLRRTRSAEALEAERAEPPKPAPEPEPPARPPHHAQSRAENGAKPDTWTPERQGLLRRLYPSTMPVEEILQEVNLLPGPAVASMGAVEAQARKLGLSRKQPPRLDGAIAPEKGIEVPPMTTEDKAEAREMLRKGKLKGERDVMEFFGCTHAEALELVDAHRASMGKAA